MSAWAVISFHRLAMRLSRSTLSVSASLTMADRRSGNTRADEAVIVARDSQPAAISLRDLAEGNPHRQRQFSPALPR
jgi:hypothetical protein